jgi:hypothetical protein
LADVDNDGDLDLMIACQSGDQNHIFINTLRQIYPPLSAQRGKPHPLDVYGIPGEMFLLYGGFQTRWIPMGSIGLLGISPSSLFALPGLHRIPPGRKLRLPLSIPNALGLKGLDLHLQGLFLNSRARFGSRFSNLFREKIQ